jgi:hypothetical protein
MIFDVNFEEHVKNKIKHNYLNTIVYAETINGEIRMTNNHNLCAERRLINCLENEAKQSGQKGAKKAKWIKKQSGGGIKIYRFTADGKYGKAFPCSICRKSLENLGLRVICTMGPDEIWFDGYMTEENKTLSKLTSGQKLLFSGINKFPINSYFHTY